MGQRRTTRRTALTGLGALGVMTTAGACSFLPGLGGEEEPAGTGAPTTEDGASDGGGESSEEPRATFDVWVTEADLDLVALDTS